MMNKITCVYCNSERIIKSGKNKKGIQTYQCNDCKRKFSETSILPDKITERCPYCGGELKYKGWSNNKSTRRYICSNCKKGFSGDLSNLKVRQIDMPCPYCGSSNIRKGGKLQSGAKRYLCNTCGKNFNENTVIVEKEHRPEKCPICQDTHIIKCGHDTKTNKQRYKCKNCGHKFIEDYVLPFIKHEKTCPRCGYVGAKKAGKSGSKKQYYICLKCNHKYLENPTYRQTTQKERFLIIKLYLQGKNYSEISKILNRNERTIRSIVDKYYKRETLTKDQLDTIYKYGVLLNIPPEFVAPYIPCTMRRCKRILAQYEKRKIIRPQLTQKEKEQDWATLDQFIK